MTDTEAWKELYQKMQNLKIKHSKLILSEDKTREMIRHQEFIKIIDEISDLLKQPIENLNDYCNNMPLFQELFSHHANFNSTLGIVEIA